MAIRQYEFTTGIETGTVPTSSDPVADSDLISLGYADQNYTSRYEIIGTAADATAVRAYTADDLSTLSTKQIVFRIDNTAFYLFDHNDVQADDGDLVLRPAHLPASGRWLKTAVFSAADDARVDVIYPFIVGTGTQVTNGQATHSSFSSAQTAASSGDKIHFLVGTLTEAITVSKKLFLEGDGAGSILNGTVTFAAGSSGSQMKNLKVTNDVTINSGVEAIVTDITLASGKTFVDNSDAADINYLFAMQET